MTDFHTFLRGIGLVPREVTTDGRWHRCPTETHPRKLNGSYKLAVDGLVGWAMDFAAHPEPLVWRPDSATPVPHIDRAAIARRESEIRRAQERASIEAREFFVGCDRLRGSHPYLLSHGLSMAGCYGLRVDSKDWLVVPVRRDGKIVSVQRISPDGEKLYWKGATTKGGCYVIDRPGATVSVVCEGLATGLAIFAATPSSRVTVAFDSGNLSRVEVPKRGLLVVAADNDHKTEARIGVNPGLDAGRAAAQLYRCGVAAPTGISGTDWCDYRQERAEAIRTSKWRARDGEVRATVDGEIALYMLRNAELRR